MKAVKRFDLLRKAEQSEGKIKAGDLDTISRVAKYGKYIFIEDGRLHVKFGMNEYTIVEKEAVNMVQALEIREFSENEELDSEVYVPFK